MPIYEYECEKCACRFELKRRFDEDAGSTCCPQCQGKIRQLYSGFYVTDNRNDRDQSSEEGKVKGEKKSEGKTDKVDGGEKSEGKTDKVDGSEKSEGKTDKVDGRKKSESK